MRVLWVGDAVVSTGFSLCTHRVCDVLHEMGHEVSVLGINYHGNPHRYPYDIYPCVSPFEGGKDVFGVGRLPILVQQLKPDVVVLLNDPWNVPSYMQTLKTVKEDNPDFIVPPVVAWCAVDGCNQRGDLINDLTKLIVWTDFAAKELKRGGYKGEIEVVPLGVDTIFRPMPREEALKVAFKGVEIPEETFVIGVVGRNQPRKRIDLSISYFAEWVKKYDISNALLYLHVAPTGEAGCDIKSLVRYYDLGGKVILNQPHIGIGAPVDEMALIYSAFDLYISTSQGEGWGLPCMEAMACGVPCIVPDWSALGDWPRDAVVRVPCTSTALTAPLNYHPYTIGGIADRDEFVESLQDMYRSEIHRMIYSRKGPALVGQERFQWSNIGARFEGILTAVVNNPSEATLEPADQRGLAEEGAV